MFITEIMVSACMAVVAAGNAGAGSPRRRSTTGFVSNSRVDNRGIRVHYSSVLQVLGKLQQGPKSKIIMLVEREKSDKGRSAIRVARVRFARQTDQRIYC